MSAHRVAIAVVRGEFADAGARLVPPEGLAYREALPGEVGALVDQVGDPGEAVAMLAEEGGFACRVPLAPGIWMYAFIEETAAWRTGTSKR